MNADEFLEIARNNNLDTYFVIGTLKLMGERHDIDAISKLMERIEHLESLAKEAADRLEEDNESLRELTTLNGLWPSDTSAAKENYLVMKQLIDELRRA